MILKGIICILPVLMFQVAYSQEVDIKIKADRRYSHEAKNITFNVLIKNKLFKEYYVQDTLITQRTVGTGACTIWSYIEKKDKKGKYLPGEFKYGSAPLLAPDSCLHACCTCLLLKKGDSVGFNINLLDSYNRIDKGEYRVYVLLHPPDPRKKVSKGYYTEFKSNYVYFTIH
jgi:hypothetical protein